MFLLIEKGSDTLVAPHLFLCRVIQVLMRRQSDVHKITMYSLLGIARQDDAWHVCVRMKPRSVTSRYGGHDHHETAKQITNFLMVTRRALLIISRGAVMCMAVTDPTRETSRPYMHKNTQWVQKLKEGRSQCDGRRSQAGIGAVATCDIYANGGSERGSNVEEEHNAWNHILDLFTLQVCSPALQQYLQEEEVCKVTSSCNFAVDVIYMSMAGFEGAGE